MAGQVFVYGTLLSSDVLKLLLGRVPTRSGATLKGFSRHRISGAVYPAIRKREDDPDSKVRGEVLQGLSEKEMFILDEYEDDDYYRKTVEPELENGDKVTADVYVWKPELESILETEDWSFEVWQERDSSDYMAMCHEFMDELRPRVSKWESGSYSDEELAEVEVNKNHLAREN